MEKSETQALKPNILIVDDTIENLELLAEILIQRGYRVTCASDGTTALMIAGNDPPDLILLDILMPKMDGYEVCRRLKAGKKTSHIPVIFLSALEDAANKVKAFASGGVDFITKPFHSEEVTARIDLHLKLRKFQKQMEEQNSLLQTEITARIHAEEDLKKHSDHLEKLVMERTAELMRENRLNERLAAISARLLAAEYDIAKTAGLILSTAQELSGSSLGYIAEINPGTKELAVFVIMPDQCSAENRQTVFPIGQDGRYSGLWGHCLNTGEPFYTNNPRHHPASRGVPERHIALERFLSVPVFVEEKLIGQIALANPLKAYTDADLNALQRLSGLYALAMQRHHWHQEQEKLKQQVQKIQKMEALGTLAGGIAHDFNNILSPILGYTEILLYGAPEGSELRQGLDQVLKAGHRARELVKQILIFCRQAEKKVEHLQIHLIVKEVLKLIRASLPSTIDIRHNIKECGMVMADPTQIHQVMMNLITNAFHAMEEKGGILSVSLNKVHLTSEDIAEPDMFPGDYICLTVADNGIGMDTTVMEHIFDPYFTTKEPGKGTGLGLAVVHGIVKSCGGGIRVFSEPGKGSEFRIYLPQAKTGEITLQPDPVKPLPGGSEHILIVDDEIPILNILRQILEHMGYQVTAHTGSMEALEAFKANPDRFDLILTDLTMPNMTGLGLAKEILSARPDIPVIMCSGFNEKMNTEKAKAYGIREYLIKPLVKKDLAWAVRRALSCCAGSGLFPTSA